MRIALAPRVTALALAAFSLAPIESQAQDGYLLQAPRVTITLRGGASVPNAGDALFDSLTNWMTLDRRDFASITFGADVAIAVTPRFDFLVGLSQARIERGSEFRDWMDSDSLPIEQRTTLKRIPLTVGGRFFVNERGRSAGKLAWVPRRLLPYVGGGAGVMWYELVQEGWFVDFETLDIFPDYFVTEGTTLLAHGLVGTEWWPAARVGLTVEGRYTYARANLKPDADFDDFENFDLSGFQLTAGIAVRF
jgi:hypothetical protein